MSGGLWRANPPTTSRAGTWGAITPPSIKAFVDEYAGTYSAGDSDDIYAGTFMGSDESDRRELAAGSAGGVAPTSGRSRLGFGTRVDTETKAADLATRRGYTRAPAIKVPTVAAMSVGTSKAGTWIALAIGLGLAVLVAKKIAKKRKRKAAAA